MNLALTSSLGLLITAVFTLLTPLAAKADLYFLYAVRIIEVRDRICHTSISCCQGLGEGVTSPAMFAMLARWSAPHERSRSGPWPMTNAVLFVVQDFIVKP